jgi:hypothetical protein
MDNSIKEIVERIIRNSEPQPTISPSWVAHAAYLELDPEKKAPARIGWLADVALRHIARHILGKRFQPDDMQDMLPNVDWPSLQQRYPLKPSKEHEPTYIKLELLEEEDMRYNVARLRSEALAKQEHADQLEQWWEDHRK